MHGVLTAARTTHLRVRAEMARCASMRPRLVLALLASLASFASHEARGDERAPVASFALDLGGVRQGFVRATVGPEKNAPAQQRLVLTAQDVAPSVATLVETFAQ